MAEDKRTMWTDVRTLVIVGAWCSPAVAINLQHGLQAGREPALIFIAVASVFFTAACFIRVESRGSIWVRMVALVLGVICATYNFTNAVGLSAGARSDARSTALTQQGARGSLADDARTIAGTIKSISGELGTSSVSSLKAEISAREYDVAFTRSKRCTDATMTESRAHCAALERAKAMLSAAEQRDKLQGELAAINVQLRAAPVVEAADPQAEAIVHALAFLGLAAEPRGVGYGLTILIAAVAELMAAFGGLVSGVRMRTHEASPERPQAVETVAAPNAYPLPLDAAEAPQGEAPDALAVFVGGLVKSDKPTAFKALYEMYEGACRAAGEEPSTRLAAGRALKARFGRVKGGDAAYYARPRLAVVAA